MTARPFIKREESEVLLYGFLLVLVLTAIAIVNVPQVQAAGVTFSASTTVSITDPAETWTIAGGSNASSVQVAVSSTVIAMENTDSITLTVNNRSFSITGNSANATVTNTPCYTNQGSGNGTIVITANSNETVTLWTAACGIFVSSRARPVQINPTYTTVITPPPSPTPTPTPAPAPAPALIPPTPGFSLLPAKPTVTQIQSAINEVLQKITQLQANPSVPNILGQLQQLVVRIAEIQQVVVGGARAATGGGGAITQPLYEGVSSSQVTALQNFLKSQGADVYPEGLVTGYFGSLTKKAVERFQEKYDIAGTGDPGYGFVGPKTRAKINSLLGQ